MMSFDESISLEYDKNLIKQLDAVSDLEGIQSDEDLQNGVATLLPLAMASMVSKYGCQGSLMLQWCQRLWPSLEHQFYSIDAAGNRYNICSNSATVTFPKDTSGKRVKWSEPQWLHKSGRLVEDSDAHMATFYYFSAGTNKSKINPEHMDEFEVTITEGRQEIRRLKINRHGITGLHCTEDTILDQKVLDTFLTLSLRYPFK